ncbi:MAG: IPT/TIG domain-containing protein [Deltaproteobacteria bacterium]|nr:IPT/TIG domain-containing protein [Deltaproteobacteria bacterium]
MRWTALSAGLLLVFVLGCDQSEGIKEIQPNFGNISGKDDVVLLGKGFKTGLTVTFGKQQATHIVVESDTKIRLKTPAGPEGVVDIYVTDASGKTIMLKGAFTYRRAGSS